MQSTKHSNSKHGLLFLDKNSSYSNHLKIKSTKNLNISLGANQSLNTLTMNSNEIKTPSQFKNDHYHNFKFKSKQQNLYNLNDCQHKLNSVVRQNEKLKQQNDLLKKQLSKIKKQKNDSFYVTSKEKYKVISRQHSRERQSGDIKGNFRKQCYQVGDLKQLKLQLSILSKQCQMYESIIDKMQNTIRRLTDQNKLLNSKHKHEQKHFDKDIRKQQFESLKQKVNLIMKEYSDLQSKMHSNELQWVIWKQQWITEKNIYLTRIRNLQLKAKEKKEN